LHPTIIVTVSSSEWLQSQVSAPKKPFVAAPENAAQAQPSTTSENPKHQKNREECWNIRLV
jgi:hypothetical protein